MIRKNFRMTNKRTGERYELVRVPYDMTKAKCNACDLNGDCPSEFAAHCRLAVGNVKGAKVWKFLDPLHEALLDVQKEMDDDGTG
jgi:hypothetical protein